MGLNSSEENGQEVRRQTTVFVVFTNFANFSNCQSLFLEKATQTLIRFFSNLMPKLCSRTGRQTNKCFWNLSEAREWKKEERGQRKMRVAAGMFAYGEKVWDGLVSPAFENEKTLKAQE